MSQEFNQNIIKAKIRKSQKALLYILKWKNFLNLPPSRGMRIGMRRSWLVIL